MESHWTLTLTSNGIYFEGRPSTIKAYRDKKSTSERFRHINLLAAISLRLFMRSFYLAINLFMQELELFLVKKFFFEIIFFHLKKFVSR